MRALVPWQVVSSLVLSSRLRNTHQGLARAAAGELSRRVVGRCAQRAVPTDYGVTGVHATFARPPRLVGKVYTQGKPLCPEPCKTSSSRM